MFLLGCSFFYVQKCFVFQIKISWVFSEIQQVASDNTCHTLYSKQECWWFLLFLLPVAVSTKLCTASIRSGDLRGVVGFASTRLAICVRERYTVLVYSSILSLIKVGQYTCTIC